ncbi:MAG: sugar phosphate isomerase/epimerase family protein [Chloroflexota bacterium]
MPEFQPRIGHTGLVWRYDTRQDVEHAVRKIGELGFHGTEFWSQIHDDFADEPAAFRDLLDRYGVTLAALFQVGSWTDRAAAGDLVETGRRLAGAIADFGGSILNLIPETRGQTRYGTDLFKVMAETMNRCGEIAREAGIRAAMHPHWGTTVETPGEIDLLLSLLDPSLVGFAPDSGQIAKGGGDPSAVARAYADRIWHVHLKDLSKEWPRMEAAGIPLDSPKGYAELGEGTCDLKGFVDVLRETGYQGWLLAELDESNYTPDQSARINRDYIIDTLGLPLGLDRTA